jgi:outer membrane protein insertion porin family
MNKKFHLFGISILIFLFLFPAISKTIEEKIDTIKEITIKGNRIIEESTILHTINTKAGNPIDPEIIRKDLQAIYDTGFFDNVTFKKEILKDGLRLIIEVDEKPMIEEIRISGSDKIDLDKIKKEINIKTGEIVNTSKISKDVQKIKDLYIEKGYYFAQVEYTLESISEHAVIVTYKIEENSKVKIVELNIEGNKGLSDFEIKRFMQTSESFWHGTMHCLMRFFSKCGKFNTVNLDTDLERIRELYKDRGYVDIKVGSPKISYIKNKKDEVRGVKIDIPVTEGELYDFGNITLTGNKVFYTSQIQKLFKNLSIPGKTVYKLFGSNKRDLVKGKIYSITTLKLAMLRIQDLYGSEGYINAYPHPEENINRENKTVDIKFNIREGEQYYLHKIIVTGNIHSRDKIIRREIPLGEGDIFRTDLMNIGTQRLEALQFFKEVKPTYEEILGIDAVDLKYDIKDEGQTQLSGGVSYGGYDKWGGTVALSQNNFFGLGQSASLQGSLTNKRALAKLSYTDHWFLNKPLILGTSLYTTKEEYSTYDESLLGGRITFGKWFNQNISYRQSYSYEIINIDLVNEDLLSRRRNLMTSRIDDAAQRNLPLQRSIVLNVDPRSDTSATTFAFVWDNRDRKIHSPTRGVYNEASFEIAGGLLGADNYFYKAENELNFYLPLWDRFVWANRGVINYADSYAGRELPIFERYYLGGPYSLRGFETKSVGPKDLYNNPIGGNKSLLFSSEFIINLNDPLKLVFFYDAGDVFAEDEVYGLKDLRTSYGIELRILIPVFPYPLRLIYADPIKPNENDRTNHFEFSIGVGFGG